jgi:dynein assembly factor 2
MDIELTQSEIEGLSKAMKKPEFISLLNEYVDEISDPKNKAEQEAYLKQLEQQGELPPGRKLLRPFAHSCLKTFTTSKRKLKIFINLCISEDIKAPNLERIKEGGNWQLPYAMGHPRHDQDNKKKNCFTFDIAFHPSAFVIAESSSKFMKLLCDTAISGANTLMQPQGEKVSEDYKLMKNLKCKGGSPGSIMVSLQRMENPHEPLKEREKTYKLSEEGPKLYKELISSQIKNQREQDDIKLKNETKLAEEEEKIKKPEEEPVKVNGLILPKHKVIYSSPVDLGEFIDNRYKTYKRPKEIVVNIAVPLLENLKECKIDVKEKHLVFDVKGIYYLEVKLDFDVVEDQAAAKFDRKRKELKIVLPVVQLPEVLHQIPDDVPLEVDEIEETRKNIGNEGKFEENFKENNEKISENQRNEEFGSEINREGKYQQESLFETEKNSKISEKKNEVMEDQREEIKKELKDDQNFSKATENKALCENPTEETKFPESHAKNDPTSLKKPEKVPKQSPCCITLKSPHLFSLY